MGYRPYDEWKDDKKDNKRDNKFRRDCVQCDPPGHPLPKPIILACGRGNGFTVKANNGTTPKFPLPPKTVAHVTIDTTCLCKPVVKVEFSSNIIFTPDGSSTPICRIEFELVRICDNRDEISLGVWQYERIDEDDAHADSFNFIFCDCNTCPGCCEYFVRATVFEAEDSTCTVCNTNIAAFAQATCDS